MSDVHLRPMPPVPIGKLFSKRITGYLNWKLNRRLTLEGNVLDDLVEHLQAQRPDHIAVTGDLVNLALPEEIAQARKWLDQLGPPDDVSVVLGNHDAYVPRAFKAATAAWRPFLSGDIDAGDAAFPYRRDRGNVTLIGVNSACATGPFMATGRFGKKQARALEKLLTQAKTAGQFRVVMIHHPPFAHATHWHKRLIGDGRFRAVIKRCGAELVLHGHTHIDSFEWIDGPERPVAVIGVPSASHSPQAVSTKLLKPGARYNLFTITGQAENWSCTFDEFGYPAGEQTIQHINSVSLFDHGAAGS